MTDLTTVEQEGIATGQFRGDLPVAAVVQVIVTQMPGMTLAAGDAQDDTTVSETLEALWSLWLEGLGPRR